MEVSASELDVEGTADVIVAAFHEEAIRHVELDKLKIMHTGIPNDDFAEDSGSQHAVLQELRKMFGLIVFDERGVRPGRPGPPASVIGEPDPVPDRRVPGVRGGAIQATLWS